MLRDVLDHIRLFRIVQNIHLRASQEIHGHIRPLIAESHQLVPKKDVFLRAYMIADPNTFHGSPMLGPG